TTGTGTVTLSGAAPTGGLPVGLSTGSPAAVGIPSQVTVPAGATSTTFAVTAGSVGAATLASIWAYSGPTQTATVWIMPVRLYPGDTVRHAWRDDVDTDPDRHSVRRGPVGCRGRKA